MFTTSQNQLDFKTVAGSFNLFAENNRGLPRIIRLLQRLLRWEEFLLSSSAKVG
jgi:hypothetical protein